MRSIAALIGRSRIAIARDTRARRAIGRASNVSGVRSGSGTKRTCPLTELTSASDP